MEGTTSASNGYIGIESSNNNAFPHTTRSPPMYYAYLLLKVVQGLARHKFLKNLKEEKWRQ